MSDKSGNLLSCATLEQRSGSLLVVLMASLLFGCADQRGEGRYALSGSVTYDGQPVTNGTIEFFPAEGNSGQPAGAKIIDGRYEMAKIEGPEQGPYRVVILANRPSGRRVPIDEGSSEMVNIPEQYIPSMYNERSTLTAEISADREDFDFALEKPKGQSRRRR